MSPPRGVEGAAPHQDLLRRLPAQNLEAERAVLGACLQDSRALDSASAALVREDFYRPVNQGIFDAMLSLRRRGEPVDAVSLVTELRSLGRLEDAGGPAGVADLSTCVATSANVGYHARLVKDASRIRQTVVALSQAQASLDDQSTPVTERLARVDGIVREATRESGDSGPVPIDRTLIECFAELRQEAVPGIPTGFHRMDRDIQSGGLVRGEVTILAGRTGVGKSFVGGTIARWATTPVARGGAGLACAFFTLEMTRLAVTKRLLCAEAGVGQGALREGARLSGPLQMELTAAGERLAEHRLSVDDSPIMGPDRLRALARGYQAERGLDLLVVDYLQLMHGHGKRYGNRQEEVADVSRALKALAVELNVGVLALAQLNRAAEERPRPRLSDLRESGALEQDAGLVLLLSVDEEATTQARAASGDVKVLHVEVAKNRHGPTTNTSLMFERGTGRVWEMSDGAFPRQVERERAGRETS